MGTDSNEELFVMDIKDVVIDNENGKVVIIFPYNITAVGMSPQDARDMAASLVISVDAVQQQAQTEVTNDE